MSKELIRKLAGMLLTACILSGCSKSAVNSAYVEVINKGVPGNVASSLLARLNDVFSVKPDLAIIMIGTNDCGTDGPDFQDYPANLAKLIDTIKGQGISVMLLTPPPLQPQSHFYDRTPRLDSICRIITSLSNSKFCYLVDVNNDLKTTIAKAGTPDLYISDGLHPNAAGYSAIGGFIGNYMNTQHLKKVKIVCFGDSITYGIDIPGAGTALGETYPAVLQKKLNLLYNSLMNQQM